MGSTDDAEPVKVFLKYRLECLAWLGRCVYAPDAGLGGQMEIPQSVNDVKNILKSSFRQRGSIECFCHIHVVLSIPDLLPDVLKGTNSATPSMSSLTFLRSRLTTQISRQNRVYTRQIRFRW